MKALSLKQPWAELIVSGKKTIETRKWNTKFRGEFLIHASKNIDSQKCEELDMRDLPTGCIVGKATIIDVKKYTDKKEYDEDENKHLAKNWTPKTHGFILTNVQRLPHKKIKGQLNFFEIK